MPARDRTSKRGSIEAAVTAFPAYSPAPTPAQRKATKAAPAKKAAAKKAAPKLPGRGRPVVAAAPGEATDGRYLERVQRHVVFLPNEVAALVQAEVERSRLSKSRVISDALREYFTR